VILITPEYRALNAELHARVPAYGTGGHKWAEVVREIVRETGAKSVLDYGCGKGTLRAALHPLTVHEYDPAVAGKETPPSSAGVVICADVMEHVEPECTDAVIAHLCALASRAVFVVVACREGGKRLADGRPAHIHVQPPAWWHAKFSEFGAFNQAPSGDDEYVALWVRK
jgi:hypothetical protein